MARQAVADGIVSAISDWTIRRILDEVDLQPHRTRYWKTVRLDAEFKDRAEKILWCDANAGRLARKGDWVVCVDEKPNLQVLERRPIRRSIPGSIEQQEFEYHQARDGQPAGVPDHPQRADGGGVRGEEGRRSLY